MKVQTQYYHNLEKAIVVQITCGSDDDSIDKAIDYLGKIV
jgi:hypothetical protein